MIAFLHLGKGLRWHAHQIASVWAVLGVKALLPGNAFETPTGATRICLFEKSELKVMNDRVNLSLFSALKLKGPQFTQLYSRPIYYHRVIYYNNKHNSFLMYVNLYQSKSEQVLCRQLSVAELLVSLERDHGHSLGYNIVLLERSNVRF